MAAVLVDATDEEVAFVGCRLEDWLLALTCAAAVEGLELDLVAPADNPPSRRPALALDVVDVVERTCESDSFDRLKLLLLAICEIK